MAILDRSDTDSQPQPADVDLELSYRSLFLHAAEGIFQSTVDGRYITVNPSLARMYGYTDPEEMMSTLTNISQQVYVDQNRRAEFERQIVNDGQVVNFESRIYRRDGTIIWISESARAVTNDRGQVRYYEGFVENITARKELELERERMLHEALERADRCSLTGLLNHRAFHKRLEEEANRSLRQGTPIAVAMLDLDSFKFFNDAYGHAAGDDVLRQVADSLRTICRTYDVLARFGGDEFAIILPGVSVDASHDFTERLKTCLDSLGYCPPGQNTVIPLSLSVGVAVYPFEGPGRLDTLALADTRLRRAKTGGDDDGHADRLRHALTGSRAGFSMLDALVTAVDNKDRYTRRHSEDVMVRSLQLAQDLDLDDHVQQTVQVSALLHDVGKIGIPDHILRKPGELNAKEYEAVKQHTLMGAIIVGAVQGFDETLDAIRHHHERWDGKGYPYGLSGEDIPLIARLMAVADAYSAMTTNRPYRKGMTPAKAMAILEHGAGTEWDPHCVATFVKSERKRLAHVPSG